MLRRTIDLTAQRVAKRAPNFCQLKVDNAVILQSNRRTVGWSELISGCTNVSNWTSSSGGGTHE